MKRMLLLMILLAMTAGTAGAAEEKGTEVKDMCLLDVKACPATGHYNLVVKITRLKAAIRKGTTVYTHTEVERLKKLLDEALEVADLLEMPDYLMPE